MRARNRFIVLPLVVVLCGVVNATCRGPVRSARTVLEPDKIPSSTLQDALPEFAENQSHLRGMPFGQWTDERRQLAAQNHLHLAYFLLRERDYYPTRGYVAHPPTVCLALSGGGMRSAAFSIGVMKGLYDEGILQTVDVISGVSGGTYALSWFYLQQRTRDISPAELFDEQGDSLKAVESEQPFVEPLVLSAVLAQGLAESANTGLRKLLLTDAVLTSTHDYYAQRIRDRFHNGGRISARELREFIAEKELPLPIINTAASPIRLGAEDPELFEATGALHQSVFEITPLRYGSEGFGYNELDERAFDFGDAVAVSGAAVDEEFNVAARPLAILSMGLGLYLNEFATGGRVAPTAEDDSYGYESPYEWTRRPVYLSDGGFTENLGLYSLIRRMCMHVIVVDAEHDPNLQFASYRKLKEGLQSQMNVELSVPAIDRLLREKTACSPRFDELTNPVSTGSITYFPTQLTSNPFDLKHLYMHITYIKLSLDSGSVAKYSPEVREYFHGTPRSACDPESGISGWGTFPQEPTHVLNYSPAQFRAYRRLGENMVADYFVDDEDDSEK